VKVVPKKPRAQELDDLESHLDGAKKAERRAMDARTTIRAKLERVRADLDEAKEKAVAARSRLDEMEKETGREEGVLDRKIGKLLVRGPGDTIEILSRRLFTAGHELGHLLLHLHAFDVSEDREDKEQEAEADVFAAKFLMPEELFEKEYRDTWGLGFVERVLTLKRIFRVSDEHAHHSTPCRMNVRYFAPRNRCTTAAWYAGLSYQASASSNVGNSRITAPSKGSPSAMRRRP
jgi:hypothetical protein